MPHSIKCQGGFYDSGQEVKQISNDCLKEEGKEF